MKLQRSETWANAVTHLRIPYSLILVPVYALAVLLALTLDRESVTLRGVLWTFIAWHGLLYPSSQAYNSYYDQDKGSVGGLKAPPPAGKKTWLLALIFEAVALVMGFIWSLSFGLSLLAFAIASRLYSYPGVRLKKYPWLSWMIVASFQGAVVVSSTVHALTESYPTWIAPLGAALWVGGIYPITQVFQHDEDRERGDHTLSLSLGVQGTALFSLATMGLGSLLLGLQRFLDLGVEGAVRWMGELSVAALPLLIWASKVRLGHWKATYETVSWLLKWSTALIVTVLGFEIFLLYSPS